MYRSFGISKEIVDLSFKAMNKARVPLYKIDEIVEFNQMKVMSAMKKYKLAEAHFAGTSGYGYNDIGREIIEKIYAEVFGTEDALVRLQFVSGTHAITTALFGILRPGDTLLAITGKPYDTLDDVIDGKNIGSLKDFGVTYKHINLTNKDEINIEAVSDFIKNNKVKVVMLQRSKGYSWRKSLNVEYLNDIIRRIKKIDPKIVTIVDNCYGEFTWKTEPNESDIIVGSLIKNPGGGLAPTGAYIAGKSKYIELIANRLTSPGMGKEVGATLGLNKNILQGLFMAPHTVGQALKTAIFCACLMEEMGFETSPKWDEERADIIEAIKFNDEEKLIKFCQGIQAGSPVDSHVTPEPWDMPGYSNKVIMAAGTFNQGASIELSADAPIKEPYIAYMQGGLTFESGKVGVMLGATKVQEIKNRE